VGGSEVDAWPRVADSGDALNKPLASRRLGERLAIAFHSVNPFLDDQAQLGVHLSLVVSVTTGADDPRALADEALILVGPFDNLNVPGAVVHEWDSSMTLWTSRS
jgi:hypothetical protein